jgi:hypothetical protein
MNGFLSSRKGKIRLDPLSNLSKSGMRFNGMEVKASLWRHDTVDVTLHTENAVLNLMFGV